MTTEPMEGHNINCCWYTSHFSKCDCGYYDWYKKQEDRLRSAGCKCAMPIWYYKEIPPHCVLCGTIAEKDK